MMARNTASRTSVRLGILILILIMILLAGEHLDKIVASHRAASAVSRLERDLDKDTQGINARFAAGLTRLEQRAEVAAQGRLSPGDSLHDLVSPATGIAAAALLDGDGKLTEARPRNAAPPAFLSRLDLEALPTSRRAVSAPYRPVSGHMAVAVAVPAGGRPGPPRLYLAAELDLSQALTHLEDEIGARGLSWCLVDSLGRRVVGAEASSELVAAGMALARRKAEAAPAAPRQVPLAFALHQPALDWTLVVWVPHAAAHNFDGRLLASFLLALAGALALLNFLAIPRG